MKFINRLRIRTVLLIGIVFMVVLVGYLGFISYTGINGLASESVPMIRENEVLMKTVLDMRRAEKDFLLHDLKNPDFFEVNSSKNLDQFQKNFEQANGVLDELQLMNDKMHILDQEQVDEVRALLEENHSDFLKLVEDFKARGFKEFGMIGDLRATIHDVEVSLDSLENNFEFEAAMLQLRRNEKDYFLRNDASYIDKFSSNIDKFESIINASDIDTSLKTSLKANLAAYESKFKEISVLDEKIGRDENDGELGAYNSSSMHLLGVLELNNRTINDSVVQEADSLLESIGVTTVLVGVLSLIIGLAIPVLVLRPIKSTNLVVEDLSRGEGDLTIQMSESKNEMGSLRKNINLFISKIREIVVIVKDNASHVAESSNELNKAISEANTNIEKVSEEVQSITSEIEHNSSIVQEVSASVQEMAESAASVREDAGILSNSVKDVASAVQDGSQELHAVSKVVDKVKANSKGVNEDIGKLEEYSNEIESIIGLITGISDQTNLLALNASIEAARAGEHGRGFAVVAEEVRKLAEESGKSTEKISTLIGMIRQMVSKTKSSIQQEAIEIDKSVEMTTTANKAFESIVEKVDSMEERIEHITDLTQKQNNVNVQIATAMDEVAKVTTNNAESAKEISASVETQVAIFEEIGASLEELNRIALNLEQETNRFKS